MGKRRKTITHPQPNRLAKLKQQLNNHLVEIIVTLGVAGIGFGFINSFGVYVLLIGLFGFLLVVSVHDKPKVFPWATLAIGIALGGVLGFNISDLTGSKINLATATATATKISAPTMTLTPPSLKTILEPQWLEADTKLQIIEGTATLICNSIYDGIGTASCTLDAIGQRAIDFWLRDDEDYLFQVYDKYYYLTLLDARTNEVFISLPYKYERNQS